MHTIDSTTINTNETVNSSLTNDNCRDIYDVILEQNKYYFITLVSNNNTEFNLRLYDSNKNIIRLNDDDKEENIYIADLNNNIHESDSNEDEDGDEDDDEDCDDDDADDDADDDEDEDEDEDEVMKCATNKNKRDIDDISSDYQKYLNDPDILNNLILDIIGTSMTPIKPSTDDLNKPNKIEIIIEIKDNDLPNESDLKALLKNNEISNNVIINFNNKIYFTPDNTGKYYLSVSSDYNYQEGEYSLNIQEVEDIKVTFDNKINIDEEIIFKAKEKFKSKKYFIDLIKGKTYKIEGSDFMKFLISKNNQLIISKDNTTIFVANFDGKYDIEVMPLKKELNNIFKIIDITSTEDIIKLNSFDDIDVGKNKIIRANKLILIDEDNSEFEVFIKNKKLEIKPFKNL